LSVCYGKANAARADARPDPTADAARSEWLDALADGRIAGPDDDGPVITPEMERGAALRQAVEALLRDPIEQRGAWGGHPASED
jgi:hypothetical protein